MAKEMANVAIAFKLSEPSPLYETIIPREVADPSDITVFTPQVSSTDKKAAETKSVPKLSRRTAIKSSLRPQTSSYIKKTIEVVHGRPTTSWAKRQEKSHLPSVTMSSTVKKDTNKSQTVAKSPSGNQITGNRINFETHVVAEDSTKPKSKRLVKMQFSSGSSNYRYADGLERSPAIKVIHQ